MMEKINCVGLFVLVMLQVVSASVLNVTMNSWKCGFDYTVMKPDYRTIVIYWDGTPLSEGCELTFKVGSSIDEACMETIQRDLPDCRPKVRFYRGYDTTHRKELDCYSSHIKFCSEGKSRISIKFHNTDMTTASNVEIKVYGVSDDDDDDDDDYLYLIRPIASAAGTVLVLIGVAIGWCVCLKINRKKERQRKEMLAANPPKSWAQQAQEQQAQGYTYNTQQNTMYPVVPPIGTAPPYPADGKMAPY